MLFTKFESSMFLEFNKGEERENMENCIDTAKKRQTTKYTERFTRKLKVMVIRKV